MPGKVSKKSLELNSRLGPNTIVLGAIRTVEDMIINFSLPNQKSGFVNLTEISSTFRSRLEQANDNDLENVIPELKKMYSSGDLLMLRVLQYEKHNGRKRLMLTMVPESVNELRISSLEKNSPIMATVSSIEDHGYGLSFGIKEAFGFLAKQKASKANILIGQTLMVWVESVEKDSSSNRQMVSCTMDSTSKMAVLNQKHSAELGSLVPGILVQAKVTEVNPVLTLKFCGVHSGTVSEFQMPVGFKATVGASVTARIISVSSQSKAVALSLLPHLVKMEIQLPKCQIGTVLENLSIIDTSSDSGCFVSCKSKHVFGFIHKSRLIDDNDDDSKVAKALKQLQQQETKVISKARCIGYDALENLLQLSIQPRLLASPVYGYRDLKPGMMVKAEITKIDENGILTQITSEIRALVPKLHVSDTVLSLPNRKFQVGQIIKAQVLAVDAENKHAYLTRKPSLINSKFKPLMNIKDAHVDMLVTGVVVALLEKGALVQFYSDLRAYVPKSEFGDKGSLTVGQPIDCRLIFVNKTEVRLAASLKLGELTNKAKTQGFKLGFDKVYEATIVSKDGADDWLVDVRVNEDNVRAVLPKNMISDVPSINDALSKPEADFVKPNLKIKVVFFAASLNHSKLPVVTTKPIVISVVQKHQKLLKKHSCVVGVVNAVLENGCKVAVLGEKMSHFVHLRELAQRFVVNGSEVVSIGQTVIAKTVSSEKHSLSFNSVPASLTDLFSLEPLEQLVNPMQRIFGVETDIPAAIGQAFTATVSKATPDGSLVGYISGKKQKIKVVVPPAHLSSNKKAKEFKSGNEITGILMVVDPLNSSAVGSLTLESVSNAKAKDALVCYIGRDYACVSDKEGKQFIGLCALKRPFFDEIAMEKIVRLNQTVVLSNCHPKHMIYFARPVAAGKRKLDSSENTEAFKKGKQVDVKIGQVYEGTVTKVADGAGVFVRLSAGISGRIMITNLSDDYVKYWKSLFKSGSPIRVFVLDYDPDSGKLELSAKKSHVDPSAVVSISSLAVGDYVDATVRKILQVGLILVVKDSKLSGLCHRSQITLKNSTDDLSKYYAIGDLVRARIIKLRPEDSRISFSFLDDSKELKANTTTQDSEEEIHSESIESDDDLKMESLSENESDIDLENSIESDIDLKNSTESDIESDIELEKDLHNESKQVLDGNDDELDFVWKDESLENESVVADEADEAEKNADLKESKNVAKLSEKVIREKEWELLKDTKPVNEEEFEKWVVREPNSSYVWIQYMALMLASGDIDKARDIGKRALEKINFRLEDEKSNIWFALLNLENSAGDAASLQKVFKEAILRNDPKKLYIKLADMFASTKKYKSAHETYQAMLKKFPGSCKVYVLAAEFYISQGKLQTARQLLQQALRQVEKRKHIKVKLQFILLEYKKMEAERGRTMFEQLLADYPKRSDLWNVYLDQELAQRNPYLQHVRRIFQKITTRKFSSKIIKNFFKRYLDFEKQYGDKKTVEEVKQAAMDYVEKHMN